MSVKYNKKFKTHSHLYVNAINVFFFLFISFICMWWADRNGIFNFRIYDLQCIYLCLIIIWVFLCMSTYPLHICGWMYMICRFDKLLVKKKISIFFSAYNLACDACKSSYNLVVGPLKPLDFCANTSRINFIINICTSLHIYLLN